MKTLKITFILLFFSVVTFSQSNETILLSDFIKSLSADSASKLTKTDSNKSRFGEGQADSIIINKNPRFCYAGVNTKTHPPLVVFNGVPVTAESEMIQNVRIDSSKHHIEVLKGASAAALYGTRGANGVIVITDKEYMKRQLKKSNKRIRKKNKKQKPKKFRYRVLDGL